MFEREAELSDFRPITLAGRSVVERVPPAGPVPDLKWVALADIVIDDSYQRPLLSSNWRAIREIADEFTWSKFIPVLIAPVADGKFALIDGQHRSHAALMRGYERVPAMIVRMAHSEQAAAFAAVNGNVIKITLFHIFKSALAAQEDWAIRAQHAVEAAGCQVMTSNKTSSMKRGGEIYAISLIRSLIKEDLDAVVTHGLRAIMKSTCADFSELFLGPFLRAWFAIVASNQQYLRLDLSGFFDDVDVLGLMDDVDARRLATHDRTPRQTQIRHAISAALKNWRVNRDEPAFALSAHRLGDAPAEQRPPQGGTLE